MADDLTPNGEQNPPRNESINSIENPMDNEADIAADLSQNEAPTETETEVEIIEPEAEPTPEELIQQANDRAEKAEKEISYRDAEIQNVRKRMLAEKASAVKYANMGLAGRMLGVLNDVDRALASVDGEDGPVLDGLRLLREKLWNELKSSGVSKIESTGKKFNPAEHEAITTIPSSDEYPPGLVIDVLEEGYMFNGRLIRAAKVVVASE